MDDFAKAFFGVRDRDWGELTYTFDDIVTTLNGVQPYDWAGFLKARVLDVAPKAPLAGIEKGGYKLVFTDEAGKVWKSREDMRHNLNLTYCSSAKPVAWARCYGIARPSTRGLPSTPRSWR